MLRNACGGFPAAQTQDDNGRCGTRIAPARWSGDAPQCLRGLPRRPDSKYPRQFRNRALHEKREADILRLAARPSGWRPAAQTQDIQGSFAIGHCTKNVKRISCVWEPDLRAGSLERRYSALPAGASPPPRLKTTTAGAVRALRRLVGAEMLRNACAGSAQ